MASQITSFTVVYSTVYSGADQRKHQSSSLLAFVRVIHQWPVNSPHRCPATRKMFPFDDVIMYRCTGYQQQWQHSTMPYYIGNQSPVNSKVSSLKLYLSPLCCLQYHVIYDRAILRLDCALIMMLEISQLPYIKHTSADPLYLQDLIITMPADTLAPGGARPSVGTVPIKKLHIFDFSPFVHQASDVMRNGWRDLTKYRGTFSVNTLRPRQDGRHFPDDIFKCIFLNEKIYFLLRFHWIVFAMVKSTILQHWFG